MLYSAALFALLIAAAQARMLNRNSVDRKLSQENVGAATFCSQPVRKGKVNFPTSLAGRAQINFNMYSGYINITSAPDYLFYWYFESQSTDPNAPLIIWTNGGPGCTAMEGATTENGPLVLFDIKEACQGGPGKCDYTMQLSANPYAWNKNAHLLYVDQPKNVGYSFGYGTACKSSREAGEDIVVFINEWLQSYPEHRGRKVIIAGESYGGHYIPAWANAILDYNQANPNSAINLAAAVIGNGCVNDTVQGTDAFVRFEHNQNLIPSTSNPKTQLAAETAMIQYLGYTPNYYDYRIESISCPACYGYNYTAWSAWFLLPEVESALNICGDAGLDAFSGSAGGCISMGNFDARDDMDYSGALGRALSSGVKVSLYYGKTDTACNYQGGYEMVNTIPWYGQSEFLNTPFTSMEVSGCESGQMKSVKGLRFYQIESAGHMVPMDQPAAAARVINDVIIDIMNNN